jgi:hypothetical protein
MAFPNLLRVLLVIHGTLAAIPSIAQNFDSMQLATQLGGLLASEGFCGLSYNQTAIEKFIDERVAADDLSFPSTLSLMTEGASYQLEDMSESSRTAHCRQVERLARNFGFIG